MISRHRVKKGTALIIPSFSTLPQMVAIVLSIVLLIGQFGCATSKSKPYTPPVLSEETREKLGTVGLVSVGFPPSPEFHKPMGKGEAASVGASTGAGTMLQGARGNNFLSLLILALAPVGAAVGGVVGAVRGVSSKKMKETEDALNRAVAGLKIQATMRDYIFMLRRSTHATNLSLLTCSSAIP
jgi:hypothetical protein